MKPSFYIFENNSTWDYTSIFSGMPKIRQFVSGSPDEDDYLDNALNCLRLIGNHHIGTREYIGKTDKEGWLCLPTLAYEIYAVTISSNNHYIERSIKTELSTKYPYGDFVSYEFFGDKIRVRHYHETDIRVLYRTILADEDGLPLITEAEAEAIAYYWIWVDTRRKMYQGNQLAANLLQLAERDKNKAINQARNHNGHYSANFFNQYFDILTSRDRKSYGKDYKLHSAS